ncbi:hypothetical protein HanRHA438_Chr05g0247141 [Helianthus annuus]|nr:hypothetical protein HanRHA438_Chr05g0247141 [Helianthus annuus]
MSLFSPYSASMGFLPVTSSINTTPKLYTSLFSFTLYVYPYSGAMYPCVPAITWLQEVVVSGWWLIFFASPKSAILGFKCSSRRMLLDLTSLWITGFSHPWCKYSRPLAAPTAISYLVIQSRPPSFLLSLCNRSQRLPLAKYS